MTLCDISYVHHNMRHPSLCVFPQNVPSTHPQNGRIRHGGAVAERNISICRSVPAVRVRQINTHTHVTDMFVCYMYSNDLDHDMSHTHTHTNSHFCQKPWCILSHAKTQLPHFRGWGLPLPQKHGAPGERVFSSAHFARFVRARSFPAEKGPFTEARSGGRGERVPG